MAGDSETNLGPAQIDFPEKETMMSSSSHGGVFGKRRLVLFSLAVLTAAAMTGIGVNLIGGGSPVCDEAAGSVSHDGRHLTEDMPEALNRWIGEQSRPIYVHALSLDKTGVDGAKKKQMFNKINEIVEIANCGREDMKARSALYAQLVELVGKNVRVQICETYKQKPANCYYLGDQNRQLYSVALTTDRNFDVVAK